jgi:exosome complex exonuclease RRP6
MEEKGDRSRESESIDLTADFKSYKARVTSSLLSATRQANALSAQDLSFHRNSSDNISRALDRQNAHLLRLTNKLLRAATSDSGIKTPHIKDRDGIDDNWPGIVDVIDDLLEKADASLDEFSGAIKRLSPSVPNRTQTPPRFQNTASPRLPHTPIEKPQLLFNRKVNNFETGPWRPLLATKPHATIPLEESIAGSDTG